MKKIGKTAICAVLTGALIVGSASAVFADDMGNTDQYLVNGAYVAPTTSMEVTGNVITASAHRAASPVLGIFGLNATSGFGMVNGSAPTDYTTATKAPALGIWGSEININPDPYYWNYFYNWYCKSEAGIAAGATEVQSSVNGGTALTNADVQASPVQADNNSKYLVAEYGNLSVSIATRPEILIGCSATASGTDVSGYDSQIATIHSFTTDSPYYHTGDENYSPSLVSYQTKYIKQMAESMHRIADAITKIKANDSTKTLRYDSQLGSNSEQVIAYDYENYVYGCVGYVESELAQKGLKEKKVAVVSSVDTTANTITLSGDSATSILRGIEYAGSVCQDVAKSSSEVVTPQDLIDRGVDVIVSVNNNSTAASKIQTIFNNTNVSYDGIQFVSDAPAAMYGVTMNSVENAFGMTYVIASIYQDELDINPTEWSAYWYEHFCHVKTDALSDVVALNYASVTSLAEAQKVLPADYSADAIEEDIYEGMTYVANSKDQFQGEVKGLYKLIGISDWTPDWTIGIGAKYNNYSIDDGICYDAEGNVAKAAGVVSVDGNYYYVNNSGAVANANGTKAAYLTIKEAKTNGLLTEGYYRVEVGGKITTNFVQKNYYYANGAIREGAGVVFADDAYYYINAKGVIYNYNAANVVYTTLKETKTNGMIGAGLYRVGTDGKITTAFIRNNYYYTNGSVGKAAGVVKVDDAYYYVKGTGVIATNVSNYTIKETKTNGLIVSKAYDIDENGQILNPVLPE